MKTFKGEFALTKDPPNPTPNPPVGDDDKIIWVSWGDYMTWHLDVIRNGIISLYGEKAVTGINMGHDGVYFFDHDDGVDFHKVGQLIGVRHSGPSVSSGSTCSDGRNRWKRRMR